MKTTNIFIAIAAVLFSFSSCEKFTDEMYEELYGKKVVQEETIDDKKEVIGNEGEVTDNNVYFEDAPTICMDYSTNNVSIKNKSDLSGLTISTSNWINANLNNGVTITVADNPGNMREGFVRLYNGEKTYSVRVIQLSQPDGSSEGHDFVEIRGTKWATCNIGATTPSDEGYKFAWGEVSTKSEYLLSNYKFYNGSSYTDYSSYNGEKKLKLNDNAARFIWRGTWTMCSYTYSSDYQIEVAYMNLKKGAVLNDGYGAVFIPGDFWSDERPYGNVGEAYKIRIGSESMHTTEEDRYKGLPIRPILAN